MEYITQENIKQTIRNLLRMKDDSKALVHIKNEEWQVLLEYLRVNTLISADNKLKRNAQNGKVVRLYISLTDNEFKTDTLDAMYVNFINDTLREVRKGRVAYAYHTYQIMELLRFELELKCDLVNGIFYIKL